MYLTHSLFFISPSCLLYLFAVAVAKCVLVFLYGNLFICVVNMKKAKVKKRSDEVRENKFRPLIMTADCGPHCRTSQIAFLSLTFSLAPIPLVCLSISVRLPQSSSFPLAFVCDLIWKAAVTPSYMSVSFLRKSTSPKTILQLFISNCTHLARLWMSSTSV